MRSSQSGFTLIELIVVIVILGIVGVVATARYQNLSDEAATAGVGGVAGELATGAAVNFGESLSGAAPSLPLTADGVDCSTDMGPLFLTGAVPTGYALAGIINCGAGAAAGDTGGNCTVSHTDTATTVDVPILCTG